jgi:hypothetical protein
MAYNPSGNVFEDIVRALGQASLQPRAATFPTGINAIALTVPPGEIWQIQWIYAQAVTGATAGNRSYRLDLGADAPPFPAGIDVAASQAANLYWVAGIDSDPQATGGLMRIGVPPLLLPPGTVISVAETALQPAGDSLSGSINYLKWSSNAP